MYLAIVDDQKSDQDDLIVLLKRYCIKRQLEAEITCFTRGEQLLDGYVPGHFSVVFLDMYTDGMTGMETARQLETLDSDCRVIFCTISHSHAVESYEVHAAYYLTKPPDYTRLCQAMDVACSALLAQNKMLCAHSRGVPLHTPLREVLYIDCNAERTRLHLLNRVVLVDERFAAVAALVAEDGRFLSCNRNVLVNMDWIASVGESDFFLDNQEQVPLRQRGRAAVKKAFLAYSLRQLRKETHQ